MIICSLIFIAAFAARYGTGFNIAGKYAGVLSNKGERIELCDAMGTSILSFKYKDSWHKQTDGGGYSLVITDSVKIDIDNWSKKSSWQVSRNIGGSPGVQ